MMEIEDVCALLGTIIVLALVIATTVEWLERIVP